jgi:dihydroorotase
MHVHFREPGFTHKEDTVTGSQAAARGGYTAVCCMPNTRPVIDNRKQAEWVRTRAKEAGLVNVLVTGALSKGQNGLEPADYEGMALGGVHALSDDGKTLMDIDLMRHAAYKAKSLGLFISDHAENHTLSAGGVIHDGETALTLGLKGIPTRAETDIVARDIDLAAETGARFHLQHISAGESVALLRDAKKRGIPVTAETAPHYFTLTEDAVNIHGTHAKMNPPLRTEADRLAIIGGLQDGTIDVIATDHAPHAAEEKALPMEQAPFGIVGLETAFAVSYTVLVKSGLIDINKLIELMSANPARILGIKNRKTDWVVFDTEKPYTINRGAFLSKGKNTPFHGMTVYGKTLLTVCNGKIIWKEGEQV